MIVIPSRRALAALGALVLLGCGGTAASSTHGGATGAGGDAAATGTGGAGTGSVGTGAGAGTTGSGGSPSTGPLPEGDTGVASHHPGDVGIAADPSVVFADDFEGYTQPDDLWQRYDNVYQLDEIAITTDPAHVHRGARAIEFTLPPSTMELANSIDKVIAPERDAL